MFWVVQFAVTHRTIFLDDDEDEIRDGDDRDGGDGDSDDNVE